PGARTQSFPVSRPSDRDCLPIVRALMTHEKGLRSVMKRKSYLIAGALVAIGATGAAAAGALYYAYPVQVSMMAALTRNFLISLNAPAGTVSTESNVAYKGPEAVATTGTAEEPSAEAPAGDWPSYNKTLASERYSPLSDINTKNVDKLKVLCTYDVGQYAAF